MHLPELPLKPQSREHQVYKLQGIDRSDSFNEGSLYDCLNISARRFPYYTTRFDRSRLMPYESATAISAWNSLLVVDGTNLYYDGVVRGQVTAGEKQFAVINTKIVIMPDKKYLDLNTLTLVDMVRNVDATGTIVSNPTSDENTQTITISNYSASAFSAYEQDDYVILKLSKGDPVVTTEYTLFFVSAAQSGSNVVLTFRKDPTATFVSDTYSAFNMKNDIPDFDYICSADNRIWGCSSKLQTIYASELGVPTRYFNLTSDNAAASWQDAVATPSDFTGCVALGSSVIFFKEYCMHKILGSKPVEYSTYTYDMDGVKKGCHKSILVINDTLYYLSNRGVMVYTGGNPTKISEGLGDIPLKEGVAGTDGERYYLYCNDGRDSLFTYDLKTGEWLREEDKKITDFARINEYLYMIIDGKVWYNTSLPLNDDWYIQFNDMYESTVNNYGRKVGTVFNKKFYSKLILRVEMEEGAYATVKVRTDGGRWENVGNIVGKRGVFTHMIPINRCDKFGVMIEGHGEFTLLAMLREQITRSVRNE